MKSRIRRTWVVALLAFSFCPFAQAEDKTVLIVSTSSVEQLLGDISYLAESLGFAEYGQMGTMMASQYMEGMDTSRPFGFLINTDGEDFRPLGLIPVKNLDDLLESLEDQFGEPEDAGDDILELAGPVPIYIKEKGGWVFVAQSTDHLEKLPDNPITLLQGLNEKYDIGVRAFVQNVPKDYREMALEQIREGVEAQLENMPDDDDAESQKEVIRNTIRQYEALAEGVDDITFGINIDPDNKRIFVETSLIAVDGTKVARQMATFQDASTRFAGFLMDTAAVTLNASTTTLEEDRSATLKMVENSTERLEKMIDESDDLPDGKLKEVLKKLANALMDVVGDTLETGKFDVSGSLLVENDDVTWVSGMAIASGEKLEKAIKEMAEEIPSEPEMPKFELSFDQHAGVKFHRISLPVPEDEEDARKWLGETLDIVVGIAKESAYVSVGANAVETLRKALDESGDQKDTLPFKLKVALTPIAKFLKKMDSEDDTIAAVAAALESADNDRILFVSEPIDKGASYHLEIHEGVLRAIGEGIQAAQGEMIAE